jgi:hypothetical protein
MRVLAGVAHHADDLLNRWRIGGVRACPCYGAGVQRDNLGASLGSDGGQQNRALMTRQSLGSPSIRQRIVVPLYQDSEPGGIVICLACARYA